MLGTDLIILNSYEAATDLLDKRGAIYSDRPVLTMLGELYVASTPSPSAFDSECRVQIRFQWNNYVLELWSCIEEE